MRDRLIELIKSAADETARIFKIESEECLKKGELPQHKRTIYDIEANYLLENGVIVPPCKIGDMLFALWSVPTEAKYVIYAAEVVEIRISGRNCRQTTTFLLEPLAYRGRRKEYRIDDFGKLVFTNKEEAEQALRKEDEGK